MQERKEAGMKADLKRLREITETLTGNGYLRERTEEWKYALEAIPDCIFVANTSFEIKFINKVLAKRLSSSIEDLYGNSCCDVVMSGVCKDFCFVKKNSELFFKEVYLEKLNGWFDITRAPIYTKTHKLIGFICILQDVTAKRQATAAIMQREVALEAVFDAAPISMGLVDKETCTILSVNKVFAQLLGYSEGELVGNSALMLFPSEKEFKKVENVGRNEMGCINVSSIDTQFVTKENKLLNVSIKFAEIGEGSTVVFTVIVLKTKEN